MPESAPETNTPLQELLDKYIADAYLVGQIGDDGEMATTMAAAIRAERARLGLTQDQLAEQIAKSRQTLSEWEAGKSSPDFDALLAMCRVFRRPIHAWVPNEPSDME